MASTYSPSLRLELMATGENRSTWGSRANVVFNMIEDAIAGHVEVAMADANVALTALDGIEDQSRYANISFTGANTAVRVATIGTVPKQYVMRNATTGGFAVTVSNGTSSGTLTNGAWHLVWTDGTTVFVSHALSIDVQPLDGDLTAIAASSGTGIHARTGTETWALRTITGTSAEITVTDGNGVSGNPTLSLPSALTFTGKTVTGGTFASGAFNGTLGATTPSSIVATTGTFSGNLTVRDDNFLITGSSDASKVLTFQVDGITTATTRVLTIPDEDTTIVGTNATQTLTNKSINASQLTGTVNTARISGSYTGITGVGALAAGSLSSTFGNISIGSSTITTTGAVSTGALSSTTGSFSSTGTFSGAVTADRFISTASSAIFGGNSSADSVLFRPDATSGTNQMTLSSSGALDVSGSVTTTQIVSTGSSQNSFTGPVAVADGSAAFPGLRFGTDTNTGFYRISENVIGVSTGGTLAATFGSTGAFTAVAGITGTTGNFSSTLTASGAVTADRFIGSSNGIFATTGSNTVFLRPNGEGSTTGQTTIASTGNMTVNGTVTATSDARLKTNVETISDALAKVNKLRGVSFTMKGQRSMGVIAQEVRDVFPELVHEDEDGYLSVAYGNAIGVMIEAIKTLTKRVEELEASA